jgi:hypothetical protein
LDKKKKPLSEINRKAVWILSIFDRIQKILFEAGRCPLKLPRKIHTSSIMDRIWDKQKTAFRRWLEGGFLFGELQRKKRGLLYCIAI